MAGDWSGDWTWRDPRLRRLPIPAGGDFSSGPLLPAVRLSYRDVEELLAERGIAVDHVTIYRWVQRFTPRVHRGGAAVPPCPR